MYILSAGGSTPVTAVVRQTNNLDLVTLDYTLRALGCTRLDQPRVSGFRLLGAGSEADSGAAKVLAMFFVYNFHIVTNMGVSRQRLQDKAWSIKASVDCIPGRRVWF